MKPLSEEERLRLVEISELDLLSGATDQILQETVKEAADAFALPIGLVSIVLDQAQSFIASYGLTGWLGDASGTPVEWSFCAHAVQRRGPLFINDTTQDALVASNPLVTDDGIRCYFGVPLITSRGFAIGTLCVLGNAQHIASEHEKATLHTLAKKVVARIEERAQGLKVTAAGAGHSKT